MNAIFVELPLRRPAGLPKMKEDASMVSNGNRMNATTQLDVYLVSRVEDGGSYDPETGEFTPTFCTVYFRIPGMPPVELEITQDQMMGIIMQMMNTVKKHSNSGILLPQVNV